MRKNEQADPQEDKQEGGKQAHELYGSPFRHMHVSPLPVDDHPGCGKQIPYPHAAGAPGILIRAGPAHPSCGRHTG